MIKISNILQLSLSALPLFSGLVSAYYSQKHDGFNNADFFDNFDFFTEPDPTHGTVEYIDRASAEKTGLIRYNPDGTIYMGVDHTTLINDNRGRRSVRIESKSRFTHGLFILDLDHHPYGCGSWPAWWTYGDNWPVNGEIDIIEGVHDEEYNKMALHTNPNCMIYDPRSDQTRFPSWLNGKPLEFRGHVVEKLVNCQSPAPGNPSDNRGCAIHDPKSPRGWYFNQAGGGVFVMEWTKDFIKIWSWTRDDVPENVLSEEPEPKDWGTPSAIFTGACDIERFFARHKIVFNITFCGDWAGNTWGQSQCATDGQTCEDFVRKNPDSFKDAHWKIRGMKVFNQ